MCLRMTTWDRIAYYGVRLWTKLILPLTAVINCVYLIEAHEISHTHVRMPIFTVIISFLSQTYCKDSMGATPYANYLEHTNSLKKTWPYGSYNCFIVSFHSVSYALHVGVILF